MATYFSRIAAAALLLIIILSLAIQPALAAAKASEAGSLKDYLVDIKKSHYGVLVPMKLSDLERLDKKSFDNIIEEILGVGNRFSVLDTGNELKKMTTFIYDYESGDIKMYNESDATRYLGAIYSNGALYKHIGYKLYVEFKKPSDIDDDRWNNAGVRVALVGISLLQSGGWVATRYDGEKHAYVYDTRFYTASRSGDSYHVTINNVPITNYLYAITITNDPQAYVYLYFNVTDIRIQLVKNNRPSAEKLFEASSSTIARYLHERTISVSSFSSILREMFNAAMSDLKSELLSRTPSELDSYLGNNLDSYAGYIRGLLGSYSLEIKSKNPIKYLSISLYIMSSGSYYVKKHWWKYNDTSGDLLDSGTTTVSRGSLGHTAERDRVYHDTEKTDDNSGGYTMDFASMGGWSIAEHKDLVTAYIVYLIESRILGQTKTIEDHLTGGGESFNVEWRQVYGYSNISSTRKNIRDTDFSSIYTDASVYFAPSGARAYDVYAMPYVVDTEENTNPSNNKIYPGFDDEKLYMPRRVSEFTPGEKLQAAFALYHVIPIRDDSLVEAMDNPDVEAGEILDFYMNEPTISSGYDASLYLNGQYKGDSIYEYVGETKNYDHTHYSQWYKDYEGSGKDRVRIEYYYEYHYSLSIHTDFAVEVATYSVSRSSYLKNYLDEVKITLTGRFSKIPKPEEVEVNPNSSENPPPSGDIALLPSLAPLYGSGIPRKIASMAGYIGGEDNPLHNAFSTIDDALTNPQGIWSYIASAAFPTYLPIPLINDIHIKQTTISLHLNRFAPGEFVGGYVYVSSVIDMSKSSRVIRTLPGVSLGTIYFEKVTVYLQDARGVVNVDYNGNIDYKEGVKEITMYTIGIGIGRPGYKIGNRFYVFPSAAVDDDDIVGSNPASGLADAASKVADLIKYLTDDSDLENAIRSIPNGAYLNVFVYFGDDSWDTVWPYVAFTLKNRARFIVGDTTGEVEMRFRIDRIEVWHVKVFKVPIIGVPIPLPVPLFRYDIHSYTGLQDDNQIWEALDQIYDNGNSNLAPGLNRDKITWLYGEATLEVRKIIGYPLFYRYDDIDLTAYAGTYIETAYRDALTRAGVHLYVVPMWVEENESGVWPLGPVFLRGPYGDGDDASSLGVAVVDPATGAILGSARVNDAGFPMEEIYIPYSSLAKYESEYNLTIIPVWYKSGGLVSPEDEPFVGIEVPVYPPETHVIASLGDNTYILYNSVYHHTSLLDKITINGHPLSEYYNVIRDNITHISETVDNVARKVKYKVLDFYNKIMGVLNDARNIDEVLQKVRETLTDTARQVFQALLQSLLERLAASLAATIAAALAPDPTGGLLSGLVQSVIEEILNRLTQNNVELDFHALLEEAIGRIVEVSTKAALAMIVYEIITRLGGDELFDVIERILDDAVNKTIAIIDSVNTRIQRMLNAMLYILDMIKHYSYYYPAFFTKITVYDAKTMARITGATSVAERHLQGLDDLFLPLDKLEVPGVNTNGLILVTQPYTVQGVLLDALAEILGSDRLRNIESNIEVYGLLLVLAGWARYFGDIVSDLGSTGATIGHALLKVSGILHSFSITYMKMVAKVMYYTTVYGLTLVFTYPTYVYVPPEYIET